VEEGARDRLLVVLLGLVLFFPGLGRRDLWNPDEARYGQVAREMVEGGTLLVPHLNGEVYREKPPLFFWAIAAAALPFGRVTETAVRLPSALAGLGTLLVVFDLGRRLFSRRAAWLAAAAFATSSKVLWQARFGQIDMFLTFLVALAVWCWARGWLEERAGWSWGFFAATGAATVAKGPAGLLPPLLAILAFLALTRDREGFRRLRLGRGLLLWAAVVLAWLVPAGLAAGPDYWRTMVFKQNLTRYADPWHHHQPWHYYLSVLPADFFPWSFLLPAAVVGGWAGVSGRRRRRSEAAEAPREKDRSGTAGDGGAPFLFALCWVAVTLVFFSLSPAKRTVYVLTMYPGLALLVGAGLDRLAPPGVLWPRRRRWLVWPLALLAALLALVTLALPPAALRRPELAVLGPTFLWVLEGALLALLAGVVLAGLAARRGEVGRAAAALAGGMAAVALAAALYLLPAFDVFKSARRLSGEVLARVAPAEEIGIYPRLDATFLFYTGRRAVPLTGEAELRAFLARPGRGWLLAQRDDLRRLAAPLPVVEVARDPDPAEGYLLLVEEDRAEAP
jgi:4-amino-4-deoxy-L-arabinose transferase-like glycosyltransferase